MDKKFYGAFVSKVHDDGKYDVYFPEDGTSEINMSIKDIKAPLMSTKQPTHWDQFREKSFSTKGESMRTPVSTSNLVSSK